MRRTVVAVGAAGLLVLAGCTAGSGGADAASPVSSGPGTTTSTPPTGTDSASVTASPSASLSETASSLPTPVVTIGAGEVAAYAYVEALTSGGGQLDAVTCGQDGSVTSERLRLAPGATALTLLDFEGHGDRTVPGSGSLDAAGGTFHGRDATLAVTFTWTC